MLHHMNSIKTTSYICSEQKSTLPLPANKHCLNTKVWNEAKRDVDLIVHALFPPLHLKQVKEIFAPINL